MDLQVDIRFLIQFDDFTFLPLCLRRFFNDAVYKMDFQPSIFQIITVSFNSCKIVYIFSLPIEAFRVTYGLLICICHLQAPNLKSKQEKHVFL